jgi:Holliday junction resolvase RusA-like endonuclease
MGEQLPIARPDALRVEAFFYFDRPKSKSKSLYHKTTKPDIDKLARSLMDGMTGVVFEDDSQVSQCWVSKFFGSPSRVEVRITTLEDEVACSVRNAKLQRKSTESAIATTTL